MQQIGAGPGEDTSKNPVPNIGISAPPIKAVSTAFRTYNEREIMLRPLVSNGISLLEKWRFKRGNKNF